MVKVPNVRMNNGLDMPGFGLGTFEVSISLLYTFGIIEKIQKIP